MANIPKVWNGTAFIEIEAAPTVAPAASTSVVGIVQLTDSTSSTSTTTAATPNSVKSAYDLAGTAIPKNTVTAAGDILYASGSATVARLGIGTANQVLSVGTAGVPTWATAAAGGVTKYQEFTSSGSFIMPNPLSGSAIVVVELFGGGGGGQAGGRQATNSDKEGGEGGAAGGYAIFSGLATDIASAGGTVTVTVAAGGAGGTAMATTGNGARGGAGGNTSFGDFIAFGAGTTYSQSGGQILQSGLLISTQNISSAFNLPTTNGAGSTSPKLFVGGLVSVDVGYGGTAAIAGTGRSAYDAGVNAAGGGAGGGYSSGSGEGLNGGKGGKRWGVPGANVALNFVDGNAPLVKFGNGATAGTQNNGAAGSAGASGTNGGGGGGGGGGANLFAGGAGGAGGQPGGGGGGGGAARGALSGAGGAGGAGRVRVWVIG